MPQAGHSIALLAVKMRVVSLSTLPEREETQAAKQKYININEFRHSVVGECQEDLEAFQRRRRHQQRRVHIGKAPEDHRQRQRE